MDTSISKRMTGRRFNDVVMRPSDCTIVGPFIIRPAEDRLLENGIGVTGVVGTETHSTGDG